MKDPVRVGIIICDRYRSCAGGKCFKALKNRHGAFSRYEGRDVELVGYTSCGGCPGGNVEYVGEEMVKNGAEVVHLATGLLVGYPPCPYIETFQEFLHLRNGVEVVLGTHPIPEKYLTLHTELGTWKEERWSEMLEPTLADEGLRRVYD